MMTRRNKTMWTAAALLVAFGLAGSGRAAVITYQGAYMDGGSLNNDGADLPGWRSTDSSKPAGLDPDGDEALGSDGWYLNDGSSVVGQIPSYITSIVTDGAVTMYRNSGNNQHVKLDDPDLAIAANVTDEEYGVFYTKDNDNYDRNDLFYSVTLAEDSTFLMGVITDGYGDTDQQADTITAQDGSGNSAGASVAVNNRQADFYVFEVAGSAGEVIDVYIAGDSWKIYNSAGLTFEAVPEPGTLALLGLGGLGVLLRRRSRRA